MKCEEKNFFDESLLNLCMGTLEKEKVNSLFENCGIGIRFMKRAMSESEDNKQISILLSYLYILKSDSFRLFTALYVFFSGRSVNVRVEE